MKKLVLMLMVATSSLLAADVSTYENCTLDSIDYTQSRGNHSFRGGSAQDSGEYIISCDAEVTLRAPRQQKFRNVIESYLPLTFHSNVSHTKVKTITEHDRLKIVGLEFSNGMVELKKVEVAKFDSSTNQVSGLDGSLLAELGSEHLSAPLRSTRAIPLTKEVRLPLGEKLYVKYQFNMGVENALVEKIESCFPKSCGIATVVTLDSRLNPGVESQPSTPVARFPLVLR